MTQKYINLKHPKQDTDIFGQAVKSYFELKDITPIHVHTRGFDADIIPVEYLFRTRDEMPELELTALKLVIGKTLDVGCCAGAHATILQHKQVEVTAIDTSKKSVEVCKKRGLKQVYQLDFFELSAEEFGQFETILLMMNGIGIAGTIQNLPQFFNQLKQLLQPNGQVLLDSTDLNYLFEKDEFEHYYGEMTYKISYKNQISKAFNWLYIDQELLQEIALDNGFKTEIILKSDSSYLAKLNLIN